MVVIPRVLCAMLSYYTPHRLTQQGSSGGNLFTTNGNNDRAGNLLLVIRFVYDLPQSEIAGQALTGIHLD